MVSQSKEVKELPTKFTEKSLEQLLDEEEEDMFDENVDYEYVYRKNLRMMIGCIQTYMVKQRKIDSNTIRMREAKTMKDALMSFLDALKIRGLLNSIYSMEELNRFFSTFESKVLRHLFIEDFMTRNIFFE
ncbi:hypothetical protein G5I_04134 [Acromyrmex echinatior]|uniref:Uncharacterized protein n=1 Tax=Acromyrmex echinatior TaxID=103372 RepID=F4WET6_ACREC|nr:hypothetical protein G5I_04134 [Acromyrmex echinatior]